MQLMSWTVARLGSRFSLLFEPYKRRVVHSALGRFLDRPLDLMVGLFDPDGTPRVLPFTAEPEATVLVNPEQFERVNSITFRGYSEAYGLRYEFNVHSVFYPQDQRLCILPAFYLEMRVNPVARVRWTPRKGPTPKQVKLFIRLRRPDTRITATGDGGGALARIDLAYRNTLTPRNESDRVTVGDDPDERFVEVCERIVSLNPGCDAVAAGDGLICDLPVTEAGSGSKWRLVWAAHVGEPVLRVKKGDQVCDATFRYCAHWAGLDEVMTEAIETRDDRLARSRRFEKVIEQASLDMAQRHLLNQSFQAWLSNCFWCDLNRDGGRPDEWFSVWAGSCLLHSPIDVEYNVSLLYLAIWPQLLKVQLCQWAEHEQNHGPSGGSFLSHDLGRGPSATGQAYPHPTEVEEASNFLLLLQAYCHWTGDRTIASERTALVGQLARYLLWTDRDGCGFPSEGVANTIDDSRAATQFASKQTYLAVKRLAALRAASTLLAMAGHADLARRCQAVVDQDVRKIDQQAWLGDHYAACVDKSTVGILDAWTGQSLPYEEMPDWDAYSIYTANGLLLPTMIGQPPLLDVNRVRKDIATAARETVSRYGCGHNSSEVENVWISQNMWRDTLAQYLKLTGTISAQRYWDMQVMSNTHHQSLGFVDSYINNNLCFYPRGITSIGALLAGPRLVIDRLAPGGTYIAVDPDRRGPLRWPLLALADWNVGRVPVCVVDDLGRVTIEGESDPVIVHGRDPNATVRGVQLIG